MSRAGQRIAFIGLGVMGFPMAGHLATKGFDVVVYNRTRSKADAWARRFQGEYASTPARAARDADLVMACVEARDRVTALGFVNRQPRRGASTRSTPATRWRSGGTRTVIGLPIISSAL